MINVNISAGQVFWGSISFVVGISFIQLLFAKWIEARLAKSIQHEYNKRLEDYKFSQMQRQKAEIVARLFAKWIKYRGSEETLLDKGDLINYYEELNQMSLELSLWIPDVALLDDIMGRFVGQENAKDIRNLIGQIRKLILNNTNDSFNSQNIALWPSQAMGDRIFK